MFIITTTKIAMSLTAITLICRIMNAGIIVMDYMLWFQILMLLNVLTKIQHILDQKC